MSEFRFELLTSSHERGSFRCGEPILDRYLATQATQDMKRNIANCFVAVESASQIVAAYYTLAAAAIPFQDLPLTISKRLPRYPVIPAARIGRLAVDQHFHRRGLGTDLLVDALFRIRDAGPAAFAILVDAKHEKAAAFYQRHGFIAFDHRPLTLFLPIDTALRALDS